MKTFEILRSDIEILSESALIRKLKSFDWTYEFTDNDRYRKQCLKELELIENQVYQLWKKSPIKALELWNAYCPWRAAEVSTPSFIFRLENQE